MNYEDLSTILETRAENQLATNFDNCKTQSERGQSPNDPPEFSPEDVEMETFEDAGVPREIFRIEKSRTSIRERRASFFLNVKDEPSTPWGVSRGDSVYMLEFFYTKSPEDISTTIDLIPKFTCCECYSKGIGFKNTPFHNSPDLLCQREFTPNDFIEKSYRRLTDYAFKFLNDKDHVNSLKFKEAYTISEFVPPSQRKLPKTNLYDVEELNKTYCTFRPFQLSIYIPFMLCAQINPMFISDEVLVCTSHQMGVNRENKTRKEIWKETKERILEKYYPERFHREFKAVIQILCVYKFVPEHSLFGRDNIPLDVVKLISDYTKEKTYFKNLTSCYWKYGLPRLHLKGFNTLEDFKKKRKIEEK